MVTGYLLCVLQLNCVLAVCHSTTNTQKLLLISLLKNRQTEAEHRRSTWRNEYTLYTRAYILSLY